MGKIGMLKLAVGLAASVGVHAVMRDVVRGACTHSDKFIKACVWVAQIAITGVIIDKAVGYTDGAIDEVVTAVNEIKKIREEGI